jgi:hypothetical protein
MRHEGAYEQQGQGPYIERDIYTPDMGSGDPDFEQEDL